MTNTNGSFRFFKHNNTEQEAESHMDEVREPHGWMVDQKLVATTVSSRRRKTGNQGENKTTSSFVHNSSVATAEGRQNGGRRVLGHAHSDVPLCILRGRSTSTSFQHDPRPITCDHDASNTNIPRLQQQQEEEMGSSKVGQTTTKKTERKKD